MGLSNHDSFLRAQLCAIWLMFHLSSTLPGMTFPYQSYTIHMCPWLDRRPYLTFSVVGSIFQLRSLSTQPRTRPLLMLWIRRVASCMSLQLCHMQTCSSNAASIVYQAKDACLRA